MNVSRRVEPSATASGSLTYQRARSSENSPDLLSDLDKCSSRHKGAVEYVTSN